jgi:NAD(P)-dependent dehydrogenase (short-subunit alcohol dehydrogenase family)
MPHGVLVAGATGSLGVAVVRELLAAGREVWGTWMSRAGRDRAEAELGGASGLTLVEADLTNPAAVDAAVAAPGEALGAVVDLVGGYAGSGPVGNADPDELERMMALNVRPLYLLARAAMPVLARAGGGALVGVAARPAVRPAGGDAAYAASKAAVLNLIRSLDAEYAEEGVRANAIVPNVIDTPQNREAMPSADRSRWVPPEEIARVVRFLVSNDAVAVSGAAVPVYGRARRP